jgi:hypothetical protein
MGRGGRARGSGGRGARRRRGGGTAERAIAGTAAAVRLAYGLGSMLAPEAMSRARLAPDVRGHPAARMNLRGFGSLHTSLALGTLHAALRGRDLRPFLAVSAGCETGDALCGLLEWRDRGRADAMVAGSLAISAAGLAAWGAAWRATA